MATGKKYFWLKLDRGFFKRHDIKIVESMPNGKDYVLFYLKLLVESIDHLGDLRFSDEIPYDENMLATITDTNIDIVRSAISIFSKLGLMTLLDDKTIHMKETKKMLGEASSTHRVQAFRERQKQLLLDDGNVTETLHETEKELDIDIDKEIDKEENIKEENSPVGSLASDDNKPVKHKYGQFKNVLLKDEEYKKLSDRYDDANDLIEFLSIYIERKGYKAKSHYLCMYSDDSWVRNAVNERKRKVGPKANAKIDWLDEYKKENGFK